MFEHMPPRVPGRMPPRSCAAWQPLPAESWRTPGPHQSKCRHSARASPECTATAGTEVRLDSGGRVGLLAAKANPHVDRETAPPP